MQENELTVKQVHLLRRTLLRLADALLWPHTDREKNDRYELLARLLGTEVCRRCAIYPLPEDFVLSVVIPVFNEANTIARVIQRVQGCELPCEIIVVDDGSTDGTREILASRQHADDLQVFFHETNQGKGAALQTGIAQARGGTIVFQDADMEYDPQDFARLLQPILEGRADVVYGSRYLSDSESGSPKWHRAGNRLITWLTNLSTGKKLSDVETCYKMVRREVLQRIAPTLQEKRFGIELEITAKLAKMKDVRFCELPICYVKRSYREGKKIGWRDAVWALWCILRYGRNG